MTDLAKRSLAAAGHYSRRLEVDRFPGIAVLCYHGVRDDHWPRNSMPFEPLHVLQSELEEHCRAVRRNAHPIALDEFVAAMSGKAQLPERAVLMTFDDGYRSVADLAAPVLDSFDIPGVVFVASSAVRNRRFFWHDAVALERDEATVEEWKRLDFDRWRLRCDEVFDKVAPRFDEKHPCAPLLVEQVESLCEKGFAVGGHSESHLILSRASREQQRREIRENKEWLEETTGKTCLAFAYPNGQPQKDYDRVSVELVEGAGYELAFTTDNGFALESEPRFELSRFFLLAGVRGHELLHRLAYSWR